MTLRRDDKGWAVTVSVDEAWLADPTRAYPVMVDPSLGAGSIDTWAYKWTCVWMCGAR